MRRSEIACRVKGLALDYDSPMTSNFRSNVICGAHAAPEQWSEG